MITTDALRNIFWTCSSPLATFLKADWAILNYHNFDPAGRDGIRPETFRKQVEFLDTHYELLTVSESFQTSMDDPTASITFDDGLMGQYNHALPILENHDAKATFYLISENLDQTQKADYMGPDEAKELNERGHEIGSHSHTHQALTRADNETIRKELNESADIIESQLDVTPSSFAYPYGLYDQRVVHIVEKSRYDTAVRTGDEFVRDSTNQYSMPRIWIHNDLSCYGFRGKLSPALTFMHQIRTFLVRNFRAE